MGLCTSVVTVLSWLSSFGSLGSLNHSLDQSDTLYIAGLFILGTLYKSHLYSSMSPIEPRFKGRIPAWSCISYIIWREYSHEAAHCWIYLGLSRSCRRRKLSLIMTLSLRFSSISSLRLHYATFACSYTQQTAVTGSLLSANCSRKASRSTLSSKENTVIYSSSPQLKSLLLTLSLAWSCLTSILPLSQCRSLATYRVAWYLKS